MNLIRFALRKPITILVLIIALFFFGIRAIQTIKIDIFPKLDLPVVYVSHPFGGYSPIQMEAFFAKPYVNIFLYVNGVKSIETKNIQGLTLMKITFYAGTNMAQAMAELNAFSTRAQTIFPPGSNPPFIFRFDTSTLPVGQLVLRSPIRSNNELLDLANIYVRSSFTSIPGLVPSPPFGGNVRTVVIHANPALLRQHNLTADQLIEALRINNYTAPSGNIRMGDYNYLASANTTLQHIRDFEKIPLYKGTVSTLTLGDVARVSDAADITAGYALVNGQRSVYISIAKSADASTWEVVQNLKKSIPSIQAQLPEDVQVSYEFDQSTYVINAVNGLLLEGIIGAILTALMVILFLRDFRGALIVILTIPTSIIAGILFLYLFGQTINIMTLSGLALAIGILVDESTVTIENIHQHLQQRKSKAQAIWDACQEIAYPKLLILICIIAVFAPAFTMSGIPGALFLPLALAISFSMICSYLLSQTFVPIMANWIMRIKAQESPSTAYSFEGVKTLYIGWITAMMPYRRSIVLGYLLLFFSAVLFLFSQIGRDILPKTDNKQFQLRLRLPEGTRIENTELQTLELLAGIQEIVGKENVAISSGYVGMHPGLFAISPIYLFMPGPHEAIIQIALRGNYAGGLDALKEQIRAKVRQQNPKNSVSFEPLELTDKVLSQGSPTPIEVRFTGRNKALNERYASLLIPQLQALKSLRDVQLGQSINYPNLSISIDRLKAAQLGTDVSIIARALIASTSSSRYTEKNIWVDPTINYPYNVQLSIAEHEMNHKEEIAGIPVLDHTNRPAMRDLAEIAEGYTYGETNNLGAMPSLTITANIHQSDLGTVEKEVQDAIAALGELPRGLQVELIGMSTTLKETLDSLQNGLLLAIAVIFLMLSANFQSFKTSATVLITVPAVLVGSLLFLLLCNSTLNLQSYMGIIMSVGVSISNAVLLINNAQSLRQKNIAAIQAAIQAASLRMRPILMTALAMLAGMLPIALGIGEAGEQSAPLGRAVIGGLLVSTGATLLILPLAFAWSSQHTALRKLSLDPEDPTSTYYIPPTKPQQDD